MRAFLSYTHFDDEHNGQFLTEFRTKLSNEVRSQTGEEFRIFQDNADLEWGQNWRLRIEEELKEADFLIPIITPSFFKSTHCKDELRRFLKREGELDRDDLILPLYFIDSIALDDPENELAAVITSRHYADWRQLRFESFTSSTVRRALTELASQIKKAIDRTAQRKKTATDEATKNYIQAVNEFLDRPVSEMMRLRQDVVAIKTSGTIAEARRLMIESKYSSIPVVGEIGLDDIQGVIGIGDLLAYCEREKDELAVTDCMRPVFFVPYTMPVALLFNKLLEVKELYDDYLNFAVVAIDEYGGVAGLITAEEIMPYRLVTKSTSIQNSG